MIQIEDHARNRGSCAVLPGAHPAHAVHVDVFLSFAGSGGAGKVEQNPVWVYGCLNRRLNRRAQRHFDAQAAPISRHRHILDGGRASAVLGHGIRHQEHIDREMFLNGGHVFLTIGSAPLPSRVAACLISLLAHLWPIRADLP